MTAEYYVNQNVLVHPLTTEAKRRSGAKEVQGLVSKTLHLFLEAHNEQIKGSLKGLEFNVAEVLSWDRLALLIQNLVTWF